MRLFRSPSPLLAVLLTVVVLLLGFAAHSPALHHALCAHADAEIGHAHRLAHDHAPCTHAGCDATSTTPTPQHPGHSCAITLFAQECSVSLPPLTLPAPAFTAILVVKFEAPLLTRASLGIERVCGPPARA